MKAICLYHHQWNRSAERSLCSPHVFLFATTVTCVPTPKRLLQFSEVRVSKLCWGAMRLLLCQLQLSDKMWYVHIQCGEPFVWIQFYIFITPFILWKQNDLKTSQKSETEPTAGSHTLFAVDLFEWQLTMKAGGRCQAAAVGSSHRDASGISGS